MKKILFILFALYSTNIMSQATMQWTERFNGPGNDYDEATSIWVDAAGNSYVGGKVTGNGTGVDMGVNKYGPDGTLLWSHQYNGPGNSEDHGYLCKADAQGNVYLSGSSTGETSGLDYCLIKYNSAGVQQWVYRYNGPGNATDEVYSFQVNSATGDVYLTGYSHGSGTGDDICTIKLNSAGSEQWVKRYDGTEHNDDYGNAIQIDAQGNCYVTAAATNANDLDYMNIKYDANGNQLWAVSYDGSANGEDFPSSNAIDNAGNLYAVGYVTNTGSQKDYCVIKYNNSGVQQWASTYNGPGSSNDEAFSIVLDAQNNVYITGNSFGNGTGDDYCTVKYNNSGVQQWVARYDGGINMDDYPDWLAVDASGNVYVTGLSQASNTFDDMVTIGYNSNGVQQWLERYNGPGDAYDSGNTLALDNQGGVYVAGGSDNPENTDFLTIKYSSPIGIQPITTEVPKTFSLLQNYPNPFNPTTNIKFNIPASGLSTQAVQLKVYDMMGKEISTLVNESLKPGGYEVRFNAANLPSGIYFYRLITQNYVETNKMILVK